MCCQQQDYELKISFVWYWASTTCITHRNWEQNNLIVLKHKEAAPSACCKATQDGAILPAQDTDFVPQGKFIMFWCFIPYNKSFIDQACSVKMAGYWPRSFLSVYGPRVSVHKHAKKRNLANIQPPWPHTWSITHIYWFHCLVVWTVKVIVNFLILLSCCSRDTSQTISMVCTSVLCYKETYLLGLSDTQRDTADN